MFEPMIKLLKEKGYRIISENRGRQRGPDIIAVKDGHQLIMEMKGDSAALGVDFGTGIFQLFRHMEPDSSDEYALGISQVYVRYARARIIMNLTLRRARGLSPVNIYGLFSTLSEAIYITWEAIARAPEETKEALKEL